MRAIGIAAYLALAIERLSQALQLYPKPAPAQIRRFEGVSREVRLDVVYHPAKTSRGYVLIPKDPYYLEAEEVLKQI